MGVVAPQSYYSAADACYRLSDEFQAAYRPLQATLVDTGGMAGSYRAVSAWSSAYDERAAAFVSTATEFARAVQYLGDILIASGYNWECANYAANRDPNKGIGPACPRTIPTELPYGAGVVTGVAATRKNSAGLESEVPELFEKVTALVGEIPDGDTDRLGQAARAWRAFAGDDAVLAARGRLQVVADGLDEFDSPDITNLTGHLRVLATAAGEIELATDDLAKATAEHQAALVGLRSDIDTRVAGTIVVASVVIAATLVRVRNPRSVTVENVATDAAAGSIAGLIGGFGSTLTGITFSTTALTTSAVAAITTLSILSITGDSTFDSSRKPPANAYDPNGPKAPGRPGDVEGFVPPKGGDRWVPNPHGRGFGWEDAKGRVWVPTGQDGSAHSGPHWDVEDPRNPRNHDNVYPGGHRR